MIPSKLGNTFIKKHHYSGKVVPNSQLHFGVFLNNQLHGVGQFGPSLDKSKIIGLVKDTKWNEFLELNRLAFDEYLPKNSESRGIAIMMRLIKKNAPHIKWVVSFADACQCGDGTIYRASGFVLTYIKKNESIYKMPDGDIIHEWQLRVNATAIKRKVMELSKGSSSLTIARGKLNMIRLKGFQLRYIYFLDKSYRSRLTVPEIPFSKIKEMGASMYKGVKRDKH